MERVAFITGAARGIGAACAYTLVKHGFRLVVHARQQVALDKFLEGLPSNIEGSSILPLIYNMEDFWDGDIDLIMFVELPD